MRPPEKCFDETRYEYLEVGDRWARVRQGRVEQCDCVGGQAQCEDTRHTGISGCLWGGLGYTMGGLDRRSLLEVTQQQGHREGPGL